MAKKIDYAALFTLRKDGRYQKELTINGKSKYIYDRDPKALYDKWQDLITHKAMTFADVAEKWKDYHFARISYKTAEAYTAPLRRLTEHFGMMPYTDITAAQIQAYIMELARKRYAKRTVQMYLDIMRMIGTYAILDGITTSNPTQAVSLPNGLQAVKRDIPTDEQISIVKQSVGATFGLFAFLLLYTGLRRGEALALTYDDIDRDNRVVHINKAVSYQGNNPVVKTTKTAAGNRDVILLDLLADKLPKSKGLIFHVSGKMLTKIQFRKRWIKYQQETGLTITPHQLRHAYATILYDAKIDEKAAQELLGHSSITVTKNIYTHIRQSRKDGTAKTLNEYVNGNSVN